MDLVTNYKSLCLCAILQIGALFVFSTSEVNAESIVQVKESKNLQESYDLHITSPSAPFADAEATVSLEHEDAWLFFDNIKPTTVKNSYLSQVLVNGVSFQEGTNGRVARYAHGTVVMPYGNSFKPLTVYSDNDFVGDSKQYSCFTYHNNLGDLDNAIKSFKLKRGYMATFANESDGTGYSRVFIADDEDIEIDMPLALSGRVSFIRVFKYDWVTKKGWCGGSYDAGLSKSTWYYNWQANLATTSDLEFVPMRAKLNWSPWSQINALQNVTHSLGLNEPDHPEQHKDDNGEKMVTVEQALAQWPEMLKSGLRVGAPATTSFGWLYEFMDKCEELNYRVDYVAVHAYWGSSASAYYNSLKQVHERTGLPIWITEWNYGANWTNEWWPNDPSEYTDANATHAYNHIKEIVEMFDTAHFIERYSIYNWVEDARAIVLKGALTKAGEFYANNNSVIAFDKKNEVVPGWNYVEPTISYRYLSLSNSISISWEDENGEMTREYLLERKVGEGDYETVYTSDDVYTKSFADPLDADNSGSISYRLKIKTMYGTYITSNEVSYFQSAGEDGFQIATLGVAGTDWNTCLFSEEYEEKPSVFLGVLDFNNLDPLTMRVNSISTKNFKLALKPWTYLDDPAIDDYDNVSIMSLPQGGYDMGGLQCEVQLVEGVGREWQYVEFSQAFDSIPAVFVTQVSNSNSNATVTGIQNVSTNGFEVCILTEEKITSSLYPEKINFFAIETGDGNIMGKPITVGLSEDGGGIKGSPYSIGLDSEYEEPILFANLQTISDDFSSVLRLYSSSTSKFKVFKQRELSSGQLVSIKSDKLAWMVMDKAGDQSSSLVEKVFNSTNVVLHPNPVVDKLYIESGEPCDVSVISLTGELLLEVNGVNTLNLATLNSGVYLCIINDQVHKIIKK